MRYIIIILFSTLFIHCQSDDEKPNRPPVAVITYEDAIDRFILNGRESTDPDGDELQFKWQSSSGNISIKPLTSTEAYFKIPPTIGEGVVEITLEVNDGKNHQKASTTITLPVLTLDRLHGLGKNLTNENSVESPHDWYFDQSESGQFSSINCGPSVATMSVKWFDGTFSFLPEDARNTYHPTGGWWYTNDIINYLNKFSVPNWTVPLTNFSDLKAEIDQGNIVILCLDMFYVRYNNNPDHRIDKFYQTNDRGWGHFIVLKGYKEIDGQLLFEAYDPYSFNSRYDDGVLKGKGRYYNASNLSRATQLWWNYAIVVSRTAPNQGGRMRPQDSNIVHMPGR